MPLRRSFGTEISGNLSKKPHLSPVQRQNIVAKFEAGISIKELSVKFERSASAI
jgi:hypothetical protein